MGSDARIRPMRPEDVVAAERLSSEGFYEVDARLSPRGGPEPQPRSPARGAQWVERTLHVLRTDPGGCWVAEDEDGLAGFATSLTRELMWILSTYADCLAVVGGAEIDYGEEEEAGQDA